VRVRITGDDAQGEHDDAQCSTYQQANDQTDDKHCSPPNRVTVVVQALLPLVRARAAVPGDGADDHGDAAGREADQRPQDGFQADDEGGPGEGHGAARADDEAHVAAVVAFLFERFDPAVVDVSEDREGQEYGYVDWTVWVHFCSYYI